MVTITCDKCGKQINSDPMQQRILPSYTIMKVSEYKPIGMVNLCHDCEKEFDTWLNGKESEQ